MAVSLTFSDNHVEDSNGLPIVGAQLYVYQATTTTLASIFSDTGLTTPLANPLTSDAEGNFSRFYIAVGTYKLRAETSLGVLIREEDSIDTGLSAGSGALPIASGGTGATTAAAARSNLDVPANSELTAISSEVSTLSTQVQAIISPPQGYLTTSTGVPIITSDATAATTVYYTPFVGAVLPLYNGTSLVATAFSELSLALSSNHVASTIYDLFVMSDSGTMRLVTGPAWNSSTAGGGSRGSGAGTTELERVNGILVNRQAITVRHSGGTTSMAARFGTYVGSMFVDGTNGQITCHRSSGSSRKWALWNAYNRQTIILRAFDSTASWTYASATIRQSNAATGNKITVFTGLQEAMIKATFIQNVQLNTSGADIGIGWGIDSTTAFSGTRSRGEFNVAGVGQASNVASYHSYASLLGISNFNLCEISNASGTNTFLGTETNMVGIAEWTG
jgi:hypothetical protein